LQHEALWIGSDTFGFRDQIVLLRVRDIGVGRRGTSNDSETKNGKRANDALQQCCILDKPIITHNQRFRPIDRQQSIPTHSTTPGIDLGPFRQRGNHGMRGFPAMDSA
jgi:hypothetical protein